jgi:hypothetical protein
MIALPIQWSIDGTMASVVDFCVDFSPKIDKKRQFQTNVSLWKSAYKTRKYRERARGIEPPSEAWEARLRRSRLPKMDSTEYIQSNTFPSEREFIEVH